MATIRPTGFDSTTGRIRHFETGDVFNSTSSGVPITQAAHGFGVGDLLYLNSSTYTKAKADASATSEVVGIVTAQTTDTFALSTGGYCIDLSGLTAGTVYFLSGGTAGLLTATEPTTAGHISKPVLIADTTTSGYFFNMRGVAIPNALHRIVDTSTITSSATPTPNSNTTALFTITALAAAPTFAAPTGAPVEGQKLMFRIKDDGTARALTWNAIYRAGDTALPTTTVINKTLYVAFIYNFTDTKWDFLANQGGF